jgi:CheY-like chemotaxis protein
MRILIVDDSKVARMSLKRALPEEYKSEIEIAKNGQEAVDKYKKNRYDVVFMDLTMPIKDGYQATKEITDFDKDAFVVVVTADIQKSGFEKVIESGASRMVPKPVTTEKLKEVLEESEKNENRV